MACAPSPIESPVAHPRVTIAVMARFIFQLLLASSFQLLTPNSSSNSELLTLLRQQISHVDVYHVQRRIVRRAGRNRERAPLEVRVLHHELHATDLRISKERLSEAERGFLYSVIGGLRERNA